MIGNVMFTVGYMSIYLHPRLNIKSFSFCLDTKRTGNLLRLTNLFSSGRAIEIVI